MSFAVRQYRRQFRDHGQRVTLLRRVVNGPERLLEGVAARVRGASREEIAGGVAASERVLLLLAEDVPDDWLPLATNDRILLAGGVRLAITQRPDDDTHRIGSTLLAIECRAS